MVEYAILNAGVGLKLLTAKITNFAAGIDWQTVAIVAGALVLLWLVFGGRRRVV